MLLFLLMIVTSYQKGCLNNEGTYQIIVKIYADRESRHTITNYVHSLLPHEYTEHITTSHNDFELAHIKHYFGTVFNTVNRTLRGTNVQFKADFSDMYKHEYSELHERHCGYLSNITTITEGFLNDFEDPHKLGQNKILVLDCRQNNPLLPTDTHIASKNACGKINGILLTHPEIMQQLLAEGLYKIFSTKSISQVSGVNEAIMADICEYVQFCNVNYEFTGAFVKDLGVLTHNTLTDGGLRGYGYNISGQFVKDFGHDDTYNVGHDDSNDNNHHDYRSFHRNDGFYHKRHNHDDDSCHYVDGHHPGHDASHHSEHGSTHHNGNEESLFGEHHFNQHHTPRVYHGTNGDHPNEPHYANEPTHPEDELHHGKNEEEAARHGGAKYDNSAISDAHH